MREIYFFHNKSTKVAVTNHHFMIGNQTYAMHHITSVKRGEVIADRTLPQVLIILGLGLIAYDLYRLYEVGTHFGFMLAGFVILILGIALLMNIHDEYSVMIKTAAGEDQPVVDTDQAYIDEIVQALNTSIISRV